MTINGIDLDVEQYNESYLESRSIHITGIPSSITSIEDDNSDQYSVARLRNNRLYKPLKKEIDLLLHTQIS